LIPAIVLAAGKSERMGSPKALLRYRGRTFLEHIVDTVKQSKAGDVLIVVGRHRDEIQQSMPDARFVYNPDFAAGMSTSIQAGIRALPGGTAGAILLLVDHPLVKSSTIDKLIDGFRPGSIIVPIFNRLRGHPVLFSQVAMDEILALQPGHGANTVLRCDPGRVIEIPVDDSGVLRDVDTPQDFDALLRENSLS
jgi:molybdenum cofactor cytidylyltransferase